MRSSSRHPSSSRSTEPTSKPSAMRSRRCPSPRPEAGRLPTTFAGTATRSLRAISGVRERASGSREGRGCIDRRFGGPPRRPSCPSLWPRWQPRRPPPQGWHVTPAGSQTDLGLWPMDVAMSPAGDLLLVANAGYAHHSLMAIDPSTGDVLQVISAAGAKSHGWWDWASGHPTGYYVGLAFSPDGRQAWASDGPGGAIHAFRIAGRILTETQHIKLTGNRGNEHAWPAGIAVGDEGTRLYVAGNLDDTLRVVDPASRSVLATVAV